ncbi:MAG TPA: FtsX-like permease family protein, partial [Bryobacteraceae bacterium]|nr:FtsX-like permease family protein [Bryobacteraceae bacterium]
GVLFGLAPAIQATRVDVGPALKESRSGESRGHRSFWKVGASQVLITAQIAVSVLMLVAAGLFARTLSNLQSIPLGFNRDNILEFTIDARKAGHRDPEISKFYADLRTQLAAIPGIWQASLAESSLASAGTGLYVTRPGDPPPEYGTAILNIGPGFLTTMQVPLIAGRDFDERDGAGSTQVAIVNEKYAAERFPHENPLGQHLYLREPKTVVARDMTIIGVAKNARYGWVRHDYRGVVYMPYDQGYPKPNEMTFVLKTSGNPLRYVENVRDIVHRADLRIPVTDIVTAKGEVEQQMSMEITLARLCSAFALLALAIAWVGLYGTMSYSVARRTGEIGIRMALGAQRRRVIWMVLREILILTAAGFLISIPIARTASKWIASFLYEMKPNDPLALSFAMATLLAAASIASFIPARRASKIDPVVALRHE